jgi:hypothetical protein
MSARLPYAALLLSVVMLVPMLSFQGAAAAPSPVTALQTIGVQGNPSNCQIAVDPLGNVHLCYYDEDSGKLMYATNAGGSWATQTIAGSGLAGSASSVAVDADGNAHVSYLGRYQNGSYDLMYASNGDGQWSSQVIDPGNVAGQTSIAVDVQGSVHISYHTGNSYDNDNLRYATNRGGAWVTEGVDTGMTGYYNAIAVSADGAAHICSYSGTGGTPLKYSTNAGGSWSTQNIEDVVKIGGQCSIAIDSMGNPHVLMSTNESIGQVDLKHAVYSGGAWSTEVIEDGGYVMGTSIAIDGQDAVHVCYRAIATNELVYATNANGSWTSQVVGGLSSSMYYGSIAVEANGNAHLCYIGTGSSGNSLMYAKIGDHMSVRLSAPANPTNLTATPKGDAVELSWSPPYDDGGSAITGYMIYRGENSGSLVNIATVNGTSYVDSEVEDGKTLYYEVVAVNANGLSDPTGAVAATLAPAPVGTGAESAPSGLINIVAIMGLVAAVSAISVMLVLRKRKA